MDGNMKDRSTANQSEDEMMGIRKGPWTFEEDAILTNYIATHGEGRWNSVARSAGLRRTGKSCRLRWLNYLRPDVRRGNITLQEQLLILDLHSRWGNRWSKIAQQLPGRTDNEIKNYWRTRVIKQAKQLKCDVNSKEFRDAMRYVWMPRLLERIHQPQKQVDPSGLLHQQGSETEWVNPNYSSSASYSATDHSESSDIAGHPEGNGSDTQMSDQGNVIACGESMDNLWNDENIWFLRQQLSDEV